MVIPVALHQNEPSLQVKPAYDWRVRVERRLDRDFDASLPDSRSDAFNRIRVGATATYGTKWSGEIQYQLAHDWVSTSSKTYSDEASDLNLLNVTYKDKDVQISVGRQKINIGSERLIGSLEWGMTGRSYDGLRVKRGAWDAFAFKVGVAVPKPGRTRIAGATYASRAGLSSLIFKHDDQAKPETNHWTLAHLWTGKSGLYSYEVEAAIQRGRATGKDLGAWAFHGMVSTTFGKSTRGSLEVNAASGGSSATATKTFDNLLPTNHKFYGSMDLQSWRNMQEIGVTLEHKIDAKWTAKGQLHSFWLMDAADAWYGAGGGANLNSAGPFSDPTGRSGRDVGREIDLEFSYKANAKVSFAAGVSAFFPGSFVRARTAGRSTNQYWSFAMLQVKF